MPSPLSHAIAGFALAPVFFRRGRLREPCLWGAVCAVLPDVDMIGFPLGFGEHPVFGHRALTHSLPMAACIAAVVALGAFRQARWDGLRLRLWLCLFLATATHGLLDALSVYGSHVTFFAPFSTLGTKFSWQPISASMLMGSASWTVRVMRAILVEARWVWLPAIAIAGIGLALRRPEPPRAAD